MMPSDHAQINTTKIIDVGPEARPVIKYSLSALMAFKRKPNFRNENDALLYNTLLDFPDFDQGCVKNDRQCLFSHRNMQLNNVSTVQWHRTQPPFIDNRNLTLGLSRVERLFAEKLENEAFTTGFEHLIPLLFETPIHSVTETATEQELYRIGYDSLALFKKWFNNAEEHCLAGAMSTLLGRKPDLSPSSDEVLTGLLFGLYIVNDHKALASIWSEIQKRVSATNDISRAYLKAAALGQVSSSLYKTTIAIWTNRFDLEKSINELMNAGHSSGFYAFAGLLLVLLNWSQQNMQTNMDVSDLSYGTQQLAAVPAYEF